MVTESYQTAGPLVYVAYTDATYAMPMAIDTGTSMPGRRARKPRIAPVKKGRAE